MKKVLISIILVLLSFAGTAFGGANVVVGQTNDSTISKSDVISNEKQTAVQKAKDDSTLLERIEAIEKDVDVYKVRTQFFESELTTQTGIFSAIIILAIAIAGFLTWNNFRRQVKEYRKEIARLIDEQRSETDKFRQNILLLRRDQNTAMGNIHTIVSQQYENNGQKDAAVFFAIKAAFHHCCAYSQYETAQLKEHNRKVCYAMLGQAMRNIEAIKTSSPPTRKPWEDGLRSAPENPLSFIDIILKDDDEEIKALAARIRVEIANILAPRNPT